MKCGLPADKPVRVKLSGDGAKFSKSSNFILLSFSFLDLHSQVLTGRGNKQLLWSIEPTLILQTIHNTGNNTFAAVCADESYWSLKEGLEPVLDEINAIVKPPTSSSNCTALDVEGTTYELECFLGGDYKVKLTTITTIRPYKN